MSTIEIEDTPMESYVDDTGPVPAGYGVNFNGDLIGVIALDATNNWCAYPLDAPPLLWPEYVFPSEWDAALAIVRSRR